MRNILGFLTLALLTFGCGSNSQRSVTGPVSRADFNAVSDGMSDPGLSGDKTDRLGTEQNKAKGKGKDKDRDKDGDKDGGKDRGKDRDKDRGDKDDDKGDKGGGTTGPGSGLIGGAGGFAVFAASTITNTGPTVVAGDIGLTPGSSVTGFPPGTLTGTLHINDAAATQAKLVLQAAYNVLVGMPCNTVAPSLDGTLTPGVYCFPSSAQLNTTLVLDAQGNPNALFIFQIGSTLTTASNSSVTLINGASAGNVFWQVGSSATLGTNTAFQGTIIASASITMTTGSSILNGRAMALTGAVTLDSNLITTPGGGGSGGPGGRGDDEGDRDRDHGRGGDEGDRDRGRGGDRGDRDRDHGRGGDEGDRNRGRGGD